MGTYQSIFDLNDEVFVTYPKAQRQDKVCDECHGKAFPAGKRCMICQGWGNVYDKTVVVWQMAGPTRVSSVILTETPSGTVEEYTVLATWDQKHRLHNIFPSKTKARSYLESSGVDFSEVVG